MAIADFGRISSASISARRTTGRPRARASTSSGLSRLIAEETTTTAASPRFCGVMADRDLDAAVAQPLHIGAVGNVGAAHAIVLVGQNLGDAAHADPADADEMDRTDVARQFHSKVSEGRAIGGAWKALKRRPLLRNGLDEIGEPLGRVDPAFGARGARRFGQLVGVLHKIAETAGKHGRRQLLLRHDPGAACLGKHARVLRLVVIERMRIGNEDRRTADHRELRDGRGAGAADDEMRIGDPLAHVVEERLDLGLDADAAKASRVASHILGARLLDDVQTPAALVGKEAERLGDELREDVRALAAAEDEQAKRRRSSLATRKASRPR